MRHYVLAALWLLLAAAPAPAAAEAGGVRKLWQAGEAAPGPERWTAQWIWRREEPKRTNAFLLARKRFEMEAAPRKALLFVTADSHYQLFFNGQFVNRGPARSATRYQAYDIVDVTALARPGGNVLAALVHHYGASTSFHDSGRPGLLLQLEVETSRGRRAIGTDQSWRVMRPEQWETGTPRIDVHQGFIEIRDFRKAVAGWTGLDFDDTNWEPAAPVLPPRSGWIPQEPAFSPRAVTPPWVSLVPRDLPYLSESPVRATNLVRTGEVLEYDKLTRTQPASNGASLANDIALILLQDIALPLERCTVSGEREYRSARGPLIVRNNPWDDSVQQLGIRSAYLVFDLGELLYGHPRLDLEAPPGTVVDLGYAAVLAGDKLVPAAMGLRLADRIVAGSGPVHWEGVERKALRYLSLTVRNAAAPVKFHFIGLTRSEYPFRETGAFEAANEPELEALWRAGAQTIRAVTTDAYTDNYREQRQYSGTSFYAARANYAAFGDTRLQRRYLVQLSKDQTANGIMPPYAPVADDRDMPVILEFNLFWVLGLHDYLLFSGDAATARQLLPAAAKVLGRFREMENREGLVEDPPYPFWIDHANIDHRGANFALNALYLMSLENHAKTLEWLGEPGAGALSERARRLRERLRGGFWEPGRGLFADGRTAAALSPRFSEQTNSLALAAGIARPEQARSIAQRMSSDDTPGLVRSSPLFMYFVSEGLFRAGYPAQAVDLLKRRFRNVLGAGFGTLPEGWSVLANFRRGYWEPYSRCTAQAEASFPPYTFMRWLLGVEATAPGMKEIVLHPPPEAVPDVRGKVPTPGGVLSVAWRRAQGTLDVEVPPGIRARLAGQEATPIPEGRHHLQFVFR